MFANIEADVAVVGSGIAGAMAAFATVSQGKRVAVFERGLALSDALASAVIRHNTFYGIESLSRVAGTGITVRRIVGWYKQGLTPEEITTEVPHLSLAQVYASLTYYHANRGRRRCRGAATGKAACATPERQVIIRLYFDEDSMRHTLLHALRGRGIDVLTALEAEMSERSDETHVDFATAQGRVRCPG